MHLPKFTRLALPAIILTLLSGCLAPGLTGWQTRVRRKTNQESLQLAYGNYNRLYFDSKLPVNTEVHLVKMCTLGDAEGDTLPPAFTGLDHFVIEINEVQNPKPNEMLMTELHEMVHVYLFVMAKDYDGSHGPAFQRCMLVLAEQGAFFDLW